MRGATRLAGVSSVALRHFNPRSSCEERHVVFDDQAISIIEFQSTLLMRGATSGMHKRIAKFKFQSTLLMRGATDTAEDICPAENISIHAPHARSDTSDQKPTRLSCYFNPRSSCEERQNGEFVEDHARGFQSTLLMRGATRTNPAGRSSSPFQSTLLMRGATCQKQGLHLLLYYFNPRSSCEERRWFVCRAWF